MVNWFGRIEKKATRAYHSAEKGYKSAEEKYKKGKKVYAKAEKMGSKALDFVLGPKKKKTKRSSSKFRTVKSNGCVCKCPK